MRHTLIIAEAGVNHNGDIATAKKLVDSAKDAGADIVNHFLSYLNLPSSCQAFSV